MLLSIIIVTRNPGVDIFPTLSSIAVLNRKDVEIVVKDNSDSDYLGPILAEFKFLNVTYVHQDDKGIFDAMNQAIDVACGEFLYFLNAGDQYYDCGLPEFLKSLNKEVGYVYGNVIKLYPFVSRIKYPRKVNKFAHYLRGFCHQAVVFRRVVIDDLGAYATNLKIGSDRLYISRAIAKFKGKSLGKYIVIYKGGGFSQINKMGKRDNELYHLGLREIFSRTELWILRAISGALQKIIKLKNFRGK